MKIAITAKSDKLSGEVDPRFGRAAYFIIFNTADDSFEAISNGSNARAAQGAGIQAAQTVAKKEVEWVISGNMGPKAFASLKAAGIKIASVESGTIEQVIKLARESKLQEIQSANVEEHWR